MKKSLFLLLVFISQVVLAQLSGNGYYRVQNYKTQRYAYIYDGWGKLEVGTQNADIGALQLWSDVNRTYDDPATVIYISNITGDRYDLEGQGTGIYKIISHYVQVLQVGNNQYNVYATQSSVSKYLSDSRSDLSYAQGVPSFNGKGELRNWSVFKINTTDNYVGITPTIHAGGKHYAPYYASFPFRAVSSGMHFYIINKVDTKYGVAVLRELTDEIIPGGTPLIVECPSTQCTNNRIEPLVSSAKIPSDNKLLGNYFALSDRNLSSVSYRPFQAATMRMLCTQADGTLGYTNAPKNLVKVTHNYEDYQCVPRNTSYLSVTSTTPANLAVMTQSEYEAYVEAMSVVNVTSLTLSQTTASLELGQSLSLTATVLPENATNKALTWTSSDPTVATVSATGQVTPLKLGQTTITVRTTDGSNLSAQCVVTVAPTLVESISLNQTTLTGHAGDQQQLTATVLPANATSKSVTWTSSDQSVATVTAEGLVQLLSVGSATITVRTTDGSNLSAQCAVSVTPILAQSISLNQTTLSGHAGDQQQLTATVLPANATSKTVEWSSSDSSVATVTAEGLVQLLSVGTATITVRTTDGSNLSAQCAVSVTPILAESISLNRSVISATEGTEFQLVATILPRNATSQDVVWSTSDESVATVDTTGLVRVCKVGEAVVTVRTTDGSNLSAQCIVTSEPILATSLVLVDTTATLLVGDSYQLQASLQPSNVTDGSLLWESSDDEVAAVSATGLVTALKPGDCRIIVRTADGSELEASCSIHVDPILVESLTLNYTEFVLDQTQPTVQLVATVLPAEATYPELEWSSSDTTILTVADGLVTLVGDGTATVTVRTTDGSNLSAQCVFNCNTGISTLYQSADAVRYFTPAGQALLAPQRGINIVRYPNGTTRKVVF